ncbi:MAG TPA: hypothetical protein VGB85_21260 [Nannocystis sp.]|jgi:hypothetical protein
MKYLAFFSLIVSIQLSGCTEKSDDTGDEGGSSGTTGGTASTTASTTDGDPTTGTPTTTGGSETGSESDTSGTGTTVAFDEDCAFLIGKKFVSQMQFPCGPPPDPNDPGPLCSDRVSFEADTFVYMSSDFGVTGTYTCEGGVIAGVDDGDGTYQGTIDAATGALVWNGNDFDVEP